MNLSFRDLRIGSRLTLGYLLVIVLMGALATVSYVSLRTVNSIATNLFEAKIPAIDALDQSDRDMQQLLVAERTIITAVPGSAEFKQQVSDYKENLQQSLDRVNTFAKLASTAEEKKLITGYRQERAKWTAMSAEVMRLVETGDPAKIAQARELSLGSAAKEFDATREYLNKLEDYELSHAKALAVSAASTYERTLFIVIGLTLLAIVLAMFIAWLITRSITKPMRKAVEFARLIASGDLTRNLDIRQRDELGTLAQALSSMSERLREMISVIVDTAKQVAGSSAEISTGAQQLASGAQNQASTLEETSASVEELTASVEQVSGHSQSQAASVEESSSNMEQMQKSVGQVSDTLTSVSKSSEDSTRTAKEGMESVSQVVAAIKSISQSSQQIAGIVTVISDIADQTNLLALNASIEAARAGEHGRGFAVVADEVSKLADRSASSTKEIEELIRQSGRNVEDGVRVAQAALDAMQAIIGGAEKTNEMVSALSADVEQQINGIREVAKATQSISEMSQSISAATEEQTTNSKQVAKAIENVNELTQQAASASEQMSSATEELTALADQMRGLVEQFKTDAGSQAARSLLPHETHKPVQREAGQRHDGNGHRESAPAASTAQPVHFEEMPLVDDEELHESFRERTNGYTVHG